MPAAGGEPGRSSRQKPRREEREAGKPLLDENLEEAVVGRLQVVPGRRACGADTADPRPERTARDGGEGPAPALDAQPDGLVAQGVEHAPGTCAQGRGRVAG